MRGTPTLVAVALLAGCGVGGTENPAKLPTQVLHDHHGGGAVKPQPTTGLLAAAVSVEDGKTRVTGTAGRLSPAEDRPTRAQARGVAGSDACGNTSASPTADNLRAVASAVVCLLNAERRGAGLPALRPNGALKKASQRMANQMVRQRFFSHDTPDGRSLVDRVRRTGYIQGDWALGENLAWGSGALATPRAIVNGWMDSPGHRSNILYAGFRDIGIGIKLGAPRPDLSAGATYVTDFGRHG